MRKWQGRVFNRARTELNLHAEPCRDAFEKNGWADPGLWIPTPGTYFQPSFLNFLPAVVSKEEPVWLTLVAAGPGFLAKEPLSTEYSSGLPAAVAKGRSAMF